MFFQNYKKKGQVFGTEALTLLKMSFGPKFYDDPNFQLPKALFKDNYIDGFLTQLVKMQLVMMQEKKVWSPQDIADFTYEFYKVIDPTDTYATQTLENQRVSNIDKLQNDDGYKNGRIAAAAYIVVIADMVEEHLKDNGLSEILNEALSLLPKLRGEIKNNNVSQNEHDKGLLLTAVISITLRQYIQDNWAY